MTMTETRPGAHDEAAHASSEAFSAQPMSGVANWLTTTDHTKVGRLYVVCSLLFGSAALALAGLVAVERIDPAALSLFDRATDAAQANSLAVWGLMFCSALPLLLGLAVAIVPLQVGARSIAFPRAATFSFWLWLAGVAGFIGSVIGNGGPAGGEPDAVDLYLLSLGIICLGLIVAAACVATTVLTHRAPGMRLDRVPFFAWSALVQGMMVLLVVPVLVGELVFQYVDHRNGRIAFLGNTGIAPYLQWMVRQPTTGLMVIPVLGIIADVIPVFAKGRNKLPGVARGAIALAGVASFGAFAQDKVYDKVTTEATFILISVLMALPAVMVIAASLSSLRKGAKVNARAPFAWAMLTGLLAMAGGVVAVLLPIKSLELLGSAYEQAQFDIAAGVAILGGLTGLMYWGPKLWGRTLPNGPASGLALLGALGVALAGGSLIVAGFIDQPRGATEFIEKDATGALNVLSTVGYGLIALTILGSLALLVQAVVAKGGEPAGADPFEGHTLEWATTSPPPPGNFVGPLPVVTSDRPLLDTREAS